MYKNFGEYEIQRVDDMDGYKFYFSGDEWLMIRASGTEPVLRNYAESSSSKKTFSILRAAEQTLLGEFANKIPKNTDKQLGTHLRNNDLDQGEARI